MYINYKNVSFKDKLEDKKTRGLWERFVAWLKILSLYPGIDDFTSLPYIFMSQVVEGIQNSKAIRKLREFIDTIEKPIIVGVHSSVPKDMVQRVSAEAVIGNRTGKKIKILFIGTVHDSEADPSSWHYEKDSVGRFAWNHGWVYPTEKEKDFIARHFQKYSKRRDIFIEQGSLNVQERFEPIAMRYRKEDSSFTDDELKYVRPQDAIGELAWMAEEALSKGLIVKNIDANNNANALSFIYEKKGLVEAAYFAFYHVINLYYFQFVEDHPEVIISLVQKWFNTAGISLSYNEVNDLYDHYNSEYPSSNPDRWYSVPVELRDEYMAKRILEADVNIVVVVHTKHVLGILKRLMPHIVFFRHRETELAEGEFSSRKIQALWTDEGVRS